LKDFYANLLHFQNVAYYTAYTKHLSSWTKSKVWGNAKQFWTLRTSIIV